MDNTRKPYRLEITLPGLPKTTNASRSHGHWAQYYKESVKWKKNILPYFWHVKPKEPLHKAKLILTRYSSKEPDFDGLVSSFKHVIDALVEGGIILDDKMSVIGQPDYRWTLASRNEGYIRIQVEERS